MIQPGNALSSIPAGLRKPLLDEYNHICQNYLERRWGPSELSGGKFCEIVHTILEGFNTNTYPSSPKKPTNFVAACRVLENNSNVPRSFQILIPRMLPALYEIRNNRGVGHAGGDVDPNHMDATAVVSMCSWIMAELTRVFHALSTEDAQCLVDSIVERKTPIIWQSGDVKRVLDTSLPLKDQILLLVSSAPTKTNVEDVFSWSGYAKRGYFNRLLRQLHQSRFIELNELHSTVEILPPGVAYCEKFYAGK